MNELPRPSMMLREQEETPSNNADPDERKIKWKDDVETMKEKIELLRKEHESAKEETEELLRRHKNELDDEDERMEGAFEQLRVLRSALNDSARRRRRRQSTPNGKGQHHERQIRSTTSPRSTTVPVNKTTAVKGYNELEIERKDVSNNDDAFDKRDVMMQLRTPALCNTRNLSQRVDDSTPILEGQHERRMHSKPTTTSSSSTQQHSTTPAEYYTSATTVLGHKNEPKIEQKKPHDPFDRLNVLQDYLSRGTKSHRVDERRKATTPITSNNTNTRGEENTTAFFDPFHNDDDNNGRRSEETTTTTATTSAPADCDPFEGLNSMTMMQQQSAFGDGETRTNDDVPLRRERRLLQSTNSTTVADGTTEAEGYASSDRWRL